MTSELTLGNEPGNVLPNATLAGAAHASLDGAVVLSHWGVIKVEGADSASFLQGQLTQDFVLLKQNEARLAAFCSAKGRMQASFIGFKRSDAEILLLCSLDILPATLKRLSMFVMRAKAKLTDASDQFVLTGLAGKAVTAVAPAGLPPGKCTQVGLASYVGLYPADGVARALQVARVGALDMALDMPTTSNLTPAVWAWGEVRSGIATITMPIVDAFVPQMLNYESVGGVNFKKGCYPGQEVVARSQFRGTLKRRAYLVHCAVAMAAGDEVYGVGDADQACGTVAQASAAPVGAPVGASSGGFDAIVSMQVAAAAAGGLTLGSALGASIDLLALPYLLLDDI